MLMVALCEWLVGLGKMMNDSLSRVTVETPSESSWSMEGGDHGLLLPPLQLART